MSGGEVEQDVILDVDGTAVGKAFDEISRRVKQIQDSVSGIQRKAEGAANSFNAGLAKSLNDLNKTVSTLERFQKTVEKYDPSAVAARQAQIRNKAVADTLKELESEDARRAKQTETAYRQNGVVARNESQKTADYDRALAKVRSQQENEIAASSAVAWTANDKVRRRQDVERSRAQRLTDKELTREYLADQRAADQQRLKDQRTFEQNRVKQARDLAQQNVANAPSSQLGGIRDASATNLTALRAQRGTGSAEDQRQLEQNIALEKEYLRLVDQRISRQDAADARVSKSDKGVDDRLDVLNAKAGERALASQLDLNAAKNRQQDLQAGINAQIERTYKLTGEEKLAAEQALKLDLERLKIANSRVVALELAARNEAKANAAVAKPSSGGGMFGGSGLLGVVGRTAAYGGAATAIYATIGAIKDGISSAIEFQDTIAKIGGVADLTGTQEEKLAASIRNVAANSRFATNEIAEATMTLAQAGFSASDIGNSLQAVANLAAAAGVSMQEATDVATSAIGAFQLQTSELPHIADVLSAALNTTKLNITQVAQGIQYAGQTAYENKISFEELTAAMATMSQAGIKSGSTMGTGLRLFITDLDAPTKKLADSFKHLGISMSDIDIKTRGLPAVLATLSQKGFSASEAFGALDKRSAAAYLVLKNNQDVLSKQIVLVNQLGNAADAASRGSDSLAGEWQRFKNIVNEKVSDGFSPFAKGLQDTLHSFNELEGNTTLKKMAADQEELKKRADEASHSSMEAAYDLDQQWKAGEQAIEDYKEALRENIAVVDEHHDALEKSKTAVNEANDALNQNQQTILSENDAIARLIQHQATLKSDTGALAAETASLMNRFEGLAAQVYGAASSYDNLLESMRKVRQQSIIMGAQKANDDALAYGNHAHEKISEANSLGQLMAGSGLVGRLPKNIQEMVQFARTHVNSQNPDDQVKLSQATRAIADYARNPKSGLKGFEADRLTGYATDISGASVNFGLKRDAETTARTGEYLGGSSGQSIMKQYDDLTGKKDPVVKAALQRALTMASAAAKAGNMGGAKAWQYMANLAQAALGSGELPHAPAGKEKHPRANHLPERQDRAVDAEALKADEAQLKAGLKGISDFGGDASADDKQIMITGSRGMTLDRLKQNLQRISNPDDPSNPGALDQWIADRTKQVEDKMKSLKLDKDTNGRGMWDDLQREIDAKKEETKRAVGEGMVKMLSKMVDSAHEIAARAEEAADNAMNMVQARVTALGRANLAGKVPDYVQQTVERQAAFAKDDRDKQQIGINQALSTKLHAAYEFAAAGKDIQTSLKLNGVDDPQIKSLQELNDEIVKLDNGTEQLKASFGGEGLIPQSFNARMQMAIANYREVNHLTSSWSDILSMDLTEGLNTAQGAMTQFFSDILSGNASVTQSFGNLARAVMGYISQMIAKMIAMKIMEVALNFLSPGGSISSQPGYASMAATHDSSVLSGLGFGTGKLYGGQIHALTGRYITDGVPNRDSVDAKIARGEFVTRKSAVDSVGVDFMRDLNNRGKAALGQFGPKIMMPRPAHQMMNVYVVSPDQQPTMGPNDVLVTIANDIYRGGPTKQLIRQVAQGG